MHSTHYSSPILMKLEFSQQIFEKYTNIKFHENPSSESRVVPCGQTNRRTNGQTGRHDETNYTDQQRFCPMRKKCLFLMNYRKLNSNMFPEFVYHPHLSLQVTGLESLAPGH